MKKINKYISMVALGALTMVFNACTDECEREASPVQTDGITAYIDFNTPTSFAFLPDDEQSFEIKIGRQLTTEQQSILRQKVKSSMFHKRLNLQPVKLKKP